MTSKINNIVLSPLKIIDNTKGDILHGIKCSDVGYGGFGDAYFSKINPSEIKGWNRHKLMTLNLIVPVEIELSLQNYQRLTIPPGLWVGFQNMNKKQSLVLNIADMEHDPEEKETKDLDQIDYTWTRI